MSNLHNYAKIKLILEKEKEKNTKYFNKITSTQVVIKDCTWLSILIKFNSILKLFLIYIVNKVKYRNAM